MIADFREFLDDNDVRTVKEYLGLNEVEQDLTAKIDEIKTHLFRMRKKIENNYDNTLRKISERYETLIIKYSIVIGIIFAVLINADFFDMYGSLSKNSVVTGKLVAQAEMINARMDKLASDLEKDEGEGFTGLEEWKTGTMDNTGRLSSELKSTGLSFGWGRSHFERVWAFITEWSEDEGKKNGKNKSKKPDTGDYFVLKQKLDDVFSLIKKAFGLFISGLLISFGAPFWHDFLEAITGVRRLLAGKAEKAGGGNSGRASQPSTPTSRRGWLPYRR